MENLQKISEDLAETRTGEWLSSQIEKLVDDNKQLKVSLLISSRRDIERAFSTSLKIQDDWMEFSPEDIKSREEEIERSDLVIWGMTAMKLFSSEYEAALDIVRSEKIPVWAVVVGLGRVNDRDNYFKNIIPREKSKLPEKSEFFLKDSETSDQIIKQIKINLDIKTNALSIDGQNRRKKNIIIELRERLASEKKQLTEEVTVRERYYEKSHAGARAINVMTAPYSNELIVSYKLLSDILLEFRGKIEKNIEEKGNELASDEIKEQLKKFQEFRQSVLETTLQTEKEKLIENVKTIAEKITTELSNYFHKPENIYVDTEKFNISIKLNLDIVKSKLTKFLNNLNSNMLESFDSIVKNIENDWVLRTTKALGKEIKLPDKEQQKKEDEDKEDESSDIDVTKKKGEGKEGESSDPDDETENKKKIKILNAAERARQHVEEKRFTQLLIECFDSCVDDWENYIKTSTKQIQTVFCDAIDECSAPGLNDISSLIKEKQKKLDKIISAEKSVLDWQRV